MNSVINKQTQHQTFNSPHSIGISRGIVVLLLNRMMMIDCWKQQPFEFSKTWSAFTNILYYFLFSTWKSIQLIGCWNARNIWNLFARDFSIQNLHLGLTTVVTEIDLSIFIVSQIHLYMDVFSILWMEIRLLNKIIEWRVESVCIGLWWTMNNEQWKTKIEMIAHFYPLHCIVFVPVFFFLEMKWKFVKSWRSGKKSEKRAVFILFAYRRKNETKSRWMTKKHILWDKRNEFSLQRVSAFDSMSEGKEKKHLMSAIYFWELAEESQLDLVNRFFFFFFLHSNGMLECLLRRLVHIRTGEEKGKVYQNIEIDYYWLKVEKKNIFQYQNVRSDTHNFSAYYQFKSI